MKTQVCSLTLDPYGEILKKKRLRRIKKKKNSKTFDVEIA